MREKTEQTRSVTDMADNCCSDGDNVMVYDIHGLKRILVTGEWNRLVYSPQERYGPKELMWMSYLSGD
jgi:hypothetical protein